MKVRLAKFIADSGHCSRRAASRLIEANAVLVNGVTARHRDRVDVTDHVEISGKKIVPSGQKTYWLYHKPVGIDCVCSSTDPDSILHVLPTGLRVYPVGRLDKDSRGLMLQTNGG